MKHTIAAAIMVVGLLSGWCDAGVTLEEARDATCYIEQLTDVAHGHGGTGFVFEETDTHYRVLTNGHVVQKNARVSLQFFPGGQPQRRVEGVVLWKRETPTFDAAVVEFRKPSRSIPVIPFVGLTSPLVGRGVDMISVGFRNMKPPPTAFKGRIINMGKDGELTFTPAPANGRSGSAILVDRGEGYEACGLLAWTTIDTAPQANIGFAMSIRIAESGWREQAAQLNCQNGWCERVPPKTQAQGLTLGILNVAPRQRYPQQQPQQMASVSGAGLDSQMRALGYVKLQDLAQYATEEQLERYRQITEETKADVAESKASLPGRVVAVAKPFIVGELVTFGKNFLAADGPVDARLKSAGRETRDHLEDFVTGQVSDEVDSHPSIRSIGKAVAVKGAEAGLAVVAAKVGIPASALVLVAGMLRGPLTSRLRRKDDDTATPDK
jgi:hypothetical protein